MEQDMNTKSSIFKIWIAFDSQQAHLDFDIQSLYFASYLSEMCSFELKTWFRR